MIRLTLAQFEMKHLLKSKINYIFMLAILCVMLIPTFLDRKEAISEVELFQATFDKNSEVIENMTDTPEASEMVADLKKLNYILQPLIAELQSGNDIAALSLEYNYEKKNLEDLESGKLFGVPIHEQKKLVAELEYLSNQNMAKVNNNQPQNLTFINYFILIFSDFISGPYLLLALSLLVVTIVSFEKRNNNVALLNLIPKKISHIFFERYFISLGFAVISVLLPLLITYIVVTLKNGSGNINYPVVFTERSIEVSIMPAITFIIQIISLIFLWIICFVSITSFVVLFSGNFFLNSFILLSLIFISQYSPLNSLSNKAILGYLPTSYINFTEVVLGGHFVPLPADSITYENGVVRLSLCSTIILILTFFILKQRKSL